MDPLVAFGIGSIVMALLSLGIVVGINNSVRS